MSNIATQITCPHCSFGRSWKLRRGKRKCKKCRREFSVKRYPVSGIRSTEDAWKRSIATFIRERTMRAVIRETNIPRCRVLRMLAHLRVCMTADALPIFHGPVELDETYIGGQRKNKRLHIRRIKTKRGHGTDKLPIVGLFDRASGKAFVIVEPKKLDIRFILFLLRKRVMPNASIYTDGFKMYRMLPKYGFRHEHVDHDGDELVRGEMHTNNIEGFWGILKRKLSCIGGIRRNHLPLFVGEIAWRFNHRNIPLPDQEKLLFELITRKEFGGKS